MANDSPSFTFTEVNAWFLRIHRLAGLYDQRLVLGQALQRSHDRIEGLPAARGLAGAPIHDEVVGPFRVLEVVLEHPQDRLDPPRLASKLATPLRLDVAHDGLGDGHRVPQAGPLLF
jgi:hypothetical protein